MKIQVIGETPTDHIDVTGGVPSTVIEVAAGLVSSVNGRTGGVTGLAEASDVTGIAEEAVADHVAADDPHGDRAWSYSTAQSHVNADDPHGDRAAAVAAIGAHAVATDPHGDRAHAATTFMPKAGGTFTGTFSGPGAFAVASDGGLTAPSLTLPATATTVSKSLVITAPTVAVSYVVWRAPKACTVVAVRGYRAGGTGTTINAIKNSSDLLAADLSLSTAGTWLSGPSVQNASMAAGDSLTLAIRSVTGTPTAVTIQVDLQGV